MNTKLLFLLFICLTCAFECFAQAPRSINTIHLTKPAFSVPAVSKSSLNPGKLAKSLMVTGFNPVPLTKDHVYLIRDIGAMYNKNGSSFHYQVVSDQLLWPNEPTALPLEGLGNPGYDTVDGITLGNGFLPPGYQTGNANFVNASSTNTHQDGILSKTKKNWFYHRVLMEDIDGDGLKDALSARANLPLLDPNGGKGQLVWMKNPGTSNPFDESLLPWEEHVIVDGPDIFFAWTDLDKDGQYEVIACEFFSQRVMLYTATNNRWDDPSAIQSYLIDDTIGAPFDVSVLDLNMDGKLDVLVTNHENEPSLSGVYAYTVPSQFNETWPRHTLASGFIVRKPGKHQATPGAATPFHPITSKSNSERPWMALSGDGSEEAYLMQPIGSPDGWQWKTSVLGVYNCTVGQLSAFDADDDGYSEIFVPAYEKNYIDVLTFKPE